MIVSGTVRPGFWSAFSQRNEWLAIIASEPDVDETTRKHYVRLLISGLMKEMRRLGGQGIVLTKIYATSETPTGISMAIHAGMETVGKRLGKRLKFVLDIDKTNSFLIDSYKEGRKLAPTGH